MKNKWKNPGNGDIGRRIAIVKENRKLIADLAPKYLGIGDVGENPSARKLNALGNKALADMGLLN